MSGVGYRRDRRTRPLNISTTTLRCPVCGHKGIAVWHKGGAEAPSQPRLEELAGGFVSVDAGPREKLRILCAACRVPAAEGQPPGA